MLNKTLCCVLNFYFLAQQTKKARKMHQKKMEDMFEELNARPNYFKDADYYERKRIENMFKILNDKPNYFKDVAHYERERIENMIKEINTTRQKMENMFEELKQFNHYLNLN